MDSSRERHRQQSFRRKPSSGDPAHFRVGYFGQHWINSSNSSNVGGDGTGDRFMSPVSLIVREEWREVLC